VVAGHGRLLACDELGWTEVPTLCLDHLTPAQARAFRIADNRLTEISEWDDRLLAEVLRVLRPGGRFVFSVNVPEPLKSRILPDALAPFTPFRAKVSDGLGEAVGVATADGDGEGEGLGVDATDVLPHAAESERLDRRLLLGREADDGAREGDPKPLACHRPPPPPPAHRRRAAVPRAGLAGA